MTLNKFQRAQAMTQQALRKAPNVKSLLTPQTTIAITGTGASGKTMFLTSLLWQLRAPEYSDFSLKKNAKISRFSPSFGRRPPKDAFPFDNYQDALVSRREWPIKTKDIQRYSCEFQRSDRRLLRRQRLNLIDLPGERVADAAIAALGDFAEWSDHMFDYFANHSDYEAGRRFHAKVQAGDIGPKAIIEEYRRVLAEFARDNKPLITPSVFTLDRDGTMAPRIAPGEESWLAGQRFAGLDADSQFAPLPRAVREQHSEAARKMRNAFRHYRDLVAKPFFEHLASSDSLIVLVDIPLLLRGDVERFNDTRIMIEDLFDALNQRSTIGRRLVRSVAQLSLSSLGRVAFVASKADLVSREDWRSDRLKALLRQMNHRSSELLPQVDVNWFVCSACVSTKRGSTKNSLIGAPLHDNPSKGHYEYRVSPLPEVWPREWKPGDFSYRDVHPAVGRNLMYPPKHHMLDAIFDFLVMN